MAKWLIALIKEKFFQDCQLHEETTKNIFCLYCCTGICHQCESDHPSHHLIQVRRSQGSALLKLDELKELIDCSQVQIYSLHKEELIYLRRQPRFEASNIKKNICSFCENYIDSGYSYCCLTCKVEHVWQKNKGKSSLLFKTNASEFLLVESKKSQRKRPVNEGVDGDQQKSVNEQRNKEVFDGDHNQNTAAQTPVDFVKWEGSSSGWSLSDIVESCNKEVFDGDHNQSAAAQTPIDFVKWEGSSGGWSLSDIVESCKKRR